MITDQQLAIKEREVAKLFLGLEADVPQPVCRPAPVDRIDRQPPTPAQRIQMILRRAEEEREDSRRPRGVNSSPASLRRQLPRD